MSEKERRLSPFTSESSPWHIRKLSLSQAMIEDETPSIYESHSFFSDSAPYTIITLKKCQGFIFNQDLFATPYQQSRALAKERKIRAFSMSHAKAKAASRKSRSNSTSRSPSSAPKSSQRRHTSYDPRPDFRGRLLAKFDSAIEDDSMDVDSEPKTKESEQQEGATDGSEMSDNSEASSEEESESEESDSGEFGDSEDDDIDEYSGYSKVKVAEIVVGPDEYSFLPKDEED